MDNFGNKIEPLFQSPKVRHVRVVAEFGKVELEHRNFLNAALGSQSLLKKAPFSTAKFDFGINKLDVQGVLNLLYIAENTGVSAYLGAIPYLATKTYLPVAAGIQGTEAHHTAVIAELIHDFFGGGPSVAPLANNNGGRDLPRSPDDVLKSVSPFIVL